MNYKIIRYKLYSAIPTNLKTPVKRIFFNFKKLWYYGTTDFFDYVTIETSTICNRRCSYCPNSVFDRGLPKNERRMNKKLFQKIIDDLSSINFCGHLSLHGFNEPLLDDRLPDLIKYAGKILPQVEILITSNGDFLGPDKYDELVSAGVDRFFISEHEADSQKNKKFKQNMKNLSAYLEKHPDRRVPVKYKIMTTDTSLQNRGGLVKVKKIDNPRCLWPDKMLTIDVNGNVILCCNDYHSSVVFGNLRTKSIAEIWNSDSYKKIRKELENHIFKLDICKKCIGD